MVLNSYSIKVCKIAFVCLIIFIVISLLVETSESKSSRSSSRSRSKSTFSRNSAYPSYKKNKKPSKPWNKKTGKYKKGIILSTLVVVPGVSYLAMRRRYSHTRTIPSSQSSYIYYNSSDIPISFNVSKNEYWTPFLLKFGGDIRSCLIVPNSTTRKDCPTMFHRYVTNETIFKFSTDFVYNHTDLVHSINEICICCGVVSFLPSTMVTLLGLTLFSWLCII